MPDLTRRRANGTLLPSIEPHVGATAGKGGMYVWKWVNALLNEEGGEGTFAPEEVQRLADEGKTVAQRIAARWLSTMMDPWVRYVVDKHGVCHAAGIDPEPGRLLERLLDRAYGKPKQVIQMDQPERSTDDIKADLQHAIESDPKMRALLMLMASGKLHVPTIVDAT